MAASDGDDDLLARIAAGDGAAFGALMDRHVDRVLALARRVLRSEADAEETTQEVLLTVWRKAGDWRPGRARFATWLYRVTLNRSLNYRERVVTRHAPLEAAAEVADAAPLAEEALQARQRDARIVAAIEALPEGQRMAVTLTYTVGLSNAEPAAAMEISVKALEALLVRARRALRLALEGVA